MRFGATPHGPSAPMTCQLGKYETLTRTGVPTRETWKLTDESVCVTAETLVVPACLTVGWTSLTGVRGQSAGPLWASSTLHLLGSVSQDKAGPPPAAGARHLPGPAS